MGAIGNYIHLTSKGYDIAGTIRQGHGNAYTAAANKSLIAQRQSVLNRIYSDMNNIAVQSLESEINNLLKELGQGGENTKDWTKEVAEFLEREITKEFDELNSIDFTKSGALKASGVGKIRTNYMSYANWRTELTNRVRQLNNYLYKMEAMTKSRDGVDINKYSLAIQQLKTLLNDTYEKTWQNISQTGLAVNKKTTINLIKQLNEIIAEYAAMPRIEFKHQDSYFKNVAKIIPEKGEELASKIVSEELKKMAAANPNITIALDESAFEDRTQKISFGELKQTTQVEENSIDISFEWETQPFNAIIKTLDLKNSVVKNITTADMSLLGLLQNENHDFVNHYFNIYAKHLGKPLYSIVSKRKEYYEVLKLTVIYNLFKSGLSGNNGKNVFIINDRSGKTVKVFSISNLINDYINGTNELISLNPENLLTDLYVNTKIEGNENRNGLRRISILLNEAHSRKLRATLRLKEME